MPPTSSDRSRPERVDNSPDHDRWLWAASEYPRPDPAARDLARQVAIADERDEELDDR